MSEIGVEGLSILELVFLWNDNLILRNAVVGIVAIDRLDRTDSSVFLDHLIHGREGEVITLIQRSVHSCSCLQLLVEFRTSLLQFRIYVIRLASLFGHQTVVIVFDFLPCIYMEIISCLSLHLVKKKTHSSEKQHYQCLPQTNQHLWFAKGHLPYP